MCSVVLDRDGNGGGDGNARLRFGTVSAGGLQLIARAVLFYTSTRPSAQPLDPTTGYGDVAFVPLRLTILDR